jgi:zinc protease
MVTPPRLLPFYASPAGSNLAVRKPNAVNPSITAEATPKTQPGLGVLPNLPVRPLLTQSFVSPSGYPLTQFTLSNGHRILVEQRPSDFVGIRTFVNSGAIAENPVKPSPLYPHTGLPSGLAHLDEHAHFLTTRNFPQKNSLTAAMNQLGACWNASTSQESIQHELFFNREELPQALRLHAESVLRPIYNPRDLLQEKANVLNEAALQERSSDSKLSNQLSQLMFDRSGSPQVLGTPQDIKAITPEQLQRFHNLAYAPTNLVTVISGNVKPEEVLTVLAPEFGGNPPRYAPLGVQALKLALGAGEIRSATIRDAQLANSQIILGFPAPAVNQYRDRMALEFLNELLNGDPLPMLQENLVNQQGVANQASTFSEVQKQASIFGLCLETRPGQEREALSAALRQLGGLAQGWIPGDQVNKIRQNLIHRFETGQENTREATKQLGEAAINNALPYYLHYAQIANLITPEDLRAVAQRYLNPNTYAVVYGLPATPATAVGGVAP